jgi:hypothetical protein
MPLSGMKVINFAMGVEPRMTESLFYSVLLNLVPFFILDWALEYLYSICSLYF